mmetsp:Transcript_29314/g.86857  ORF Transcript_29314/g.86857 Transcript_29314/m.86857 type:complete len:227 (-) Transcript_29314:3164-3844(-)
MVEATSSVDLSIFSIGLTLSHMTVSIRPRLKLCVAATMTCSSAHSRGREPLRLRASSRSRALSRSLLLSSFRSTDFVVLARTLLRYFLIHTSPVATVVARRAFSLSSSPNFASSILGIWVKSTSPRGSSAALAPAVFLSSVPPEVFDSASILPFDVEEGAASNLDSSILVVASSVCEAQDPDDFGFSPALAKSLVSLFCCPNSSFISVAICPTRAAALSRLSNTAV